MNSFEQSYSGLRRLLISTVAVVGLANVAQAQVAELKGLMDNKDFGGSSSFYLPLGNITTGMPFFSIGAGLLSGSKSGEALVGFGKGLGDNIGIRGYAGVGLKDSHHNLFTTARAGIELSFGGVGLNVSGSVPFGKTRQVAKNGHTDVVLVDPNGQQCDPTGACTPLPPSCSNPLPGQVKHCEVAITVTGPSYEKALKGFEVGLDYQVQVGGVWLRPSLGYYRYGNGIVSGVKAGLEVSVPLTSQLSLNIGAGGQRAFNKGDNKALSGFGSLGVSYHFGGVAVSQLSALEHRFAEAPNRNQRTLTTYTKQGNTNIYRNTNNPGQGIVGLTPMVGAIWNMNSRGHFVSNIYLIDAATASQLDNVVATAEEDAIVLVDGSKGNINLDNTIEFKNAGVGVVGGASHLEVMATIDGGKTFIPETVTMPGTRPKLVQADVNKDIFFADGVENPIAFGLNMEKGYHGVAFGNNKDSRLTNLSISGTKVDGILLYVATDAQLKDLVVMGAKGHGLFFFRSNNIQLSNIISSQAGLDGLYFLESNNAKLRNVTSNEAGAEGLGFTNSNDAWLHEIEVNKATHNSILFANSDRAQLSYIVTNQGDAIHFYQSNQVQAYHIVANNPTSRGLNFYSSKGLVVDDMRINNSGYIGLDVQDSENIQLNNITLNNTKEIAFNVNRTTNIQIDNLKIDQAGDFGFVMSYVQNVKLNNVTINQTTRDALIIFEGYDIQLNRLSIDQAMRPISVGIRIDSSGRTGQEVSFKDVHVQNTTLGYVLERGSVVNDLGGNTATGVTNICDGGVDTTGIILVNGTERCQ